MRQPCDVDFQTASNVSKNTEVRELFELTLLTLIVSQRYHEIDQALKFARSIKLLSYVSTEVCKFLIAESTEVRHVDYHNVWAQLITGKAILRVNKKEAPLAPADYATKET